MVDRLMEVTDNSDTTPKNVRLKAIAGDPDSAHAIAVDGSASTQPVSGTVTAETNLGKAIDSVVGGTDTGVAALAKRVTTVATITPANGDYAPLQVDSYGRLWTAGKEYFSSIAQGDYSNIVPWTKVGYNPGITTATETIWSAGGMYVFPPSAQQMEVISSDLTSQDIGTILKSATADAGGTTTTLVDADAGFVVAGVAIGDWLICDKSGTTPEWAKITGVSATTLTFSGGLSSGGVGTSRVYSVLDYSATSGAQAIRILYLNGSYVEDTEIVILNGNTAVATVQTDLFRINGVRVICAGSGNVPVGNISLRETDDAPTYAYITAGFTRTRGSFYTVPDAKTLYITDLNIGWVTPNDTKIQAARIFVQANQEPNTYFLNGSIFYGYGEIIISNATAGLARPVEQKFVAKTDLRVDCIAFTGGTGPASSVMRGYLVG